jgi:Na+/proline symporter
VIRRAVLIAALVFIAGFAFLTYTEVAERGVTLAGLLSIFILVLLGVGVIGALASPRQ